MHFSRYGWAGEDDTPVCCNYKNSCAKKKSKFFAANPKVPKSGADKYLRTGNPAGVWDSGRIMNSNEVLAMYEKVAGLTSQMLAAAQAGDMARLAQLETRCVIESAATATGVPALEGVERKRKIELLKQIMANDRAIREVTEPWMARVDAIACAH
jgi:flagellar protein FliT